MVKIEEKIGKLSQSNELKNEMERVKRMYKKAIRKAQNMYFKDTHESLRAFKDKRSKAILEYIKIPAKYQENISIDQHKVILRITCIAYRPVTLA